MWPPLWQRLASNIMLNTENRISVILIMVVSVIFLAVASFLYNQTTTTLDDHYNRFGASLATVVASGAVDHVSSPLSPQLKVKAFVDRMLDDDSDLVAIEFYNPAGELVYQNRDIQALSTDNQRTFTAQLEHPAGTGRAPTYLGTVNITLSGQTVADISGNIRTLLIVVFFSAWLLTVMAVVVNSVFLQKHLRHLLQGVKRLSSGDFGYRINEKDLWGELRELAKSFNDMSMRLRIYEDQNLDTIAIERNKFEAVLLSIGDGTIVVNHAGDIVMMNPTACKHLSVESEETLLGRNIQDYICEDGKKTFETLLDDFKRHIRQPDPPRFARQARLPELTLNVSVGTIQDADGNDLGFVLTTHDVTREAEVDKLKTHFISNVSHELRTPVTTIQSYVDTLYHHSDDLDEATRTEFMDTLYQETDRLKKMVNDVLDFSKLQEEATLRREWQELAPIINLTVQSFKVLAQQKNLSISTNIESNLPGLLIHSETIERVMRNLLSNAIKYTEDGGRVKVRAELTDHDELGQCVEVRVEDTGIGIPKAYLGKIFDRFFRVENEVHTVKGTGLGLHLVKMAVEKHHHGEVFVASDEGEGSTFGFRLPVAELTSPSRPDVTPV